MKVVGTTLLCLILSIASVDSTPTPTLTCATSGSSSSSACQNINNHNHHPNPIHHNVFGIPSSGTPIQYKVTSSQIYNNPLLGIRGGALHEPETLQDVEALVLKAAMNNQLLVIDFSATWCGPCRIIGPVFHELSDEINNVVFVKVDVDDNPETAAKYSVSAMPTFVFIKKGQVVDRLMGANASRLKSMIQEHM